VLPLSRAGSAHWEVLLRARAIETQCYVAAAAQVGRHNDKRTTYGHAMIVDPWGTVLAQCSDATSPGLAVAEVDLAYLQDVRTRMPVRAHQRPDVYASDPIVTLMLPEDEAGAHAPRGGGSHCEVDG
jgi:predicted amidohydrolase